MRVTNATSRRTRTALILGASRGIGLETVKQYHADGQCVIAAVRTQEVAHALQALGVKTHVLDLTGINAVVGLAWKLNGGALDVATYVAGIYGPCTQGATSVSQANFDVVMHTNVWAPMDVLPTVLSMVEAGRNGVDESGGVLAVISSYMGSIGDMAGNGGWLYRVSKMAVNVASCGVSIDVKNVTCPTFHPGWVQTDMGSADAAIALQEGVASVRCVIVGTTRVDSGGFRNHDGSVIGW